MSGIQYLVLVSLGLFLFYICYLLVIRKGAGLKQIRFFLVVSILLSLILPVLPIKFNFPFLTDQLSVKPLAILNTMSVPESPAEQEINENIGIWEIIQLGYFFIALILLTRFVLSLVRVFGYLRRSEKVKKGAYSFVLLNKKIVAFSFFHWIFISKSDRNNYYSQIIEHEKVHARQYHSLDIMLSELMVAALWFNPFAWMFKSAIRQIHEFLADEGVLNSGANVLEYKSLLVNQAAEGKLVAISSHFSYSLIKKRIVMMSEKKTNSRSGLKILLIIPVAALVLMSVSLQTSHSPVNPKTANSIIDNGTNSDNSNAPQISKNELIGQGELSLTLDGYDNSVAFRVVSFTVSTMIKNFEESYDQTNGPKFTRQQLDLIKRAQSGRKLYIENIKARGPEGEIRELGSIVFTIK